MDIKTLWIIITLAKSKTQKKIKIFNEGHEDSTHHDWFVNLENEEITKNSPFFLWITSEGSQEGSLDARILSDALASFSDSTLDQEFNIIRIFLFACFDNGEPSTPFQQKQLQKRRFEETRRLCSSYSPKEKRKFVFR
jgi:hypothetical protein